jgi:hypothetical protein
MSPRSYPPEDRFQVRVETEHPLVGDLLGLAFWLPAEDSIPALVVVIC